MALKIADKEFNWRLFTGTGKSAESIQWKMPYWHLNRQLVTVALKRVNMDGKDDDILAHFSTSSPCYPTLPA